MPSAAPIDFVGTPTSDTNVPGTDTDPPIQRPQDTDEYFVGGQKAAISTGLDTERDFQISIGRYFGSTLPANATIEVMARSPESDRQSAVQVSIKIDMAKRMLAQCSCSHSIKLRP